jgi:hypothetical protein
MQMYRKPLARAGHAMTRTPADTCTAPHLPQLTPEAVPGNAVQVQVLRYKAMLKAECCC